MNEWLEFEGYNRGKIRLHISTIVGITPCGTDAYGSNILLKNPIGIMVAIMEKPDEVWEKFNKIKKNEELTNWMIERILRLQIRMALKMGLDVHSLLQELEERENGKQ